MCGTLVVLASRVGKYDLACVNAAKTHTSFLEIGRHGFVNLSLSFEGVFYNNLIDAVTRERYELKAREKRCFAVSQPPFPLILVSLTEIPRVYTSRLQV